MNKCTDLVREFLERGMSESCPIIDMHAHYGPYRGIYLPYALAEDMLATLNARNVEKIICSTHDALIESSGNEEIAAVHEKYPDRFFGYWAHNPHYPKDIARDLDRFDKNRGFLGFKLHPSWHQYPLTGKNYEPVFKYADDHKLIVLSHTWGGSSVDGPQQVRAVVEKHPGITFLMGHAAYGDWEKAVALARDFPNVYLELTAAYAVNGVIEYFVKEAGSERILFGTDLPWFDPAYAIGCIVLARISDEDRYNILYGNAQRLFCEQGLCD